MASRHSYAGLPDSQTSNHLPSHLQPRNSLPYGLTPAAPPLPPPPYSAYSPANTYPLPYNYQPMSMPYAPPLSPPPPYNPSYNVNEYSAQHNYYLYNPTQPHPQPEFPANYPPYQHIPQQNYVQPEHPYPDGDIKKSPPFHSPSVDDNVFPSTRSSPSRESIRSVSSIGFEGNESIHSSNGLYPTLPTTVPSNDHNSNDVSQDYVRTPLPPNNVSLWEGSKTSRLYFIQQEGHVVSPNRDLSLIAYKCPPMIDVSSYPIGSLAGNARNATVLLDIVDTWRLGISKERSYGARGTQGEYAFYDDSTSPARCVVLLFPKGIPNAEKQRLDVLLNGSCFMLNEPANMVDKFESGFGSVLGSITHSVDSAVKKQTPDLHKSTKWLRKGTGQVVRFGGSLVSKGVHLVSDNVMDKETPKEAAPQHHEVFKALTSYREAVEKKKVTKVNSLQ